MTELKASSKESGSKTLFKIGSFERSELSSRWNSWSSCVTFSLETWMYEVSLSVIFTIVPEKGSDLRTSPIFWTAPIWTGAIPVMIWPETFVWIGNGTSPKLMKVALLSVSKNDTSTCWWVTVPFSKVVSLSGTSARIPIS